MTINTLQPDDFEDFVSLINALADFEHLDAPDQDAVTRLYNDAFGDVPRYEAFIARTEDGTAVAYAIIFETYSSFLAKPSLYLEDIFVRVEYRRAGIAAKIMRFLAALATERGCGRMEWQVLDWNKNAIEFYDKLGARQMKEWLPYRMTADDFALLLRN